MQLRDVGEFGLIARIERAVGRARRDGVVVGIGDDAAVLRLGRHEDLVASVDSMVEGVHFRFDWETPRAIGRRALAAALSDLAAMGARPVAVLAALAAPRTLAIERADGITRGLVEAARRWKAPLVGGNVARARETSLTLTVLGAVARGRALRRSAARPDDRIFVTGALGATALALARRRRGQPARIAPEPRLAAGRALARMRGVGACIDVSDGLVADLGHVLDASRVGARLEVERLPLAPGLRAGARRLGLDPVRLALAGGEDYELLFTLRPGAPGARILARRLGVAVTEIGRVVRGRGLRGVERDAAGYRHF